MAVAAVAVLHAELWADEPYELLRSARTLWWTVVAGVLTAVSYGLGLPELPTRRRDAVIRSLVAVAAAVVVVSVFQLVFAAPLLPRSSLALLTVIAPLWALIAWNMAHDMMEWQTQRDQVFLVVDDPGDVGAVQMELDQRPESPAVVVGSMVVAEASGADAGARPLVDAVERSGASVVVLDTTAQSDDGIVAQAAHLHRLGLRVRTLALFYEGWLGKLPVGELARVSLLFDIGELHRQQYVRAKRVVDVACAAVGLVALVFVSPLVAMGNAMANPGPLLFVQDRVGRDGRVFRIVKFRTMVPAAGTGTSGAAPWTEEADPRVTSFGGWLRRSHIDELPQMINILRGELSLVGPRPEQPHYVDELADKIPFFDVRHLVRPGLTGWAQVKMGYAAGTLDAFEKLQYDFYYLRRQGLALDFRIAWRTVRGVLGGGGR